MSTNTKTKEHKPMCLILGFWVFLSFSMSSELFQNIFSAVSATVDILKNSFLLCHSATDWKKGKGKASFQRDAYSVCFNEINVSLHLLWPGVVLWTTYQKNAVSLQAFENYSLKSMCCFLLSLHLAKSQHFHPLKKLVAINYEINASEIIFSSDMDSSVLWPT